MHHLPCVIGKAVKGSEDVALEADLENVWQFLLATQTRFIRAWAAKENFKVSVVVQNPGTGDSFLKAEFSQGDAKDKGKTALSAPATGPKKRTRSQRTMKSQRRSPQGRTCS
jgi:hypothetical protein